MTHEQAAYRHHPLDAETPTVADQPQTELRDRIAAVLRPHASLGGTPPRYELPYFGGATPSLPRISGWKPLDDVAADVAAVLPPPADRAAVCICGHTEQQHFEDACLVCDCGDFLPPAAAREVIARYQEAAKRKPADRAAVLREAADQIVQVHDRLITEPETTGKFLAGMARATAELRRLAAEAQQPETCRNCRGSGLDPRHNGEYACPDCAGGAANRVAAEAQQPEETVRCPLCPDARPLDTPADAHAHFTTVHPEQRLEGPGPWPLLANREQPAVGARQLDTETSTAALVEAQQPEDPATLSGRVARAIAKDASALRMDLYDDLATFARETGNPGLQHAQIRDHLAEFLFEGLLRRAVTEPAAETQQQPDTKPPAEDPARIDRLRPEFTDHASIESIDAQLRRARAQERRWHIRAEWLTSLRQARVDQKARGEWPAAEQQPAAADTGEETVHGCPPDGSGLTPCCGRTPFELPLGDRISSEAPTTCTGTGTEEA